MSEGNGSALEDMGFLTVHDVQNLKGAVQTLNINVSRLELAARAQADAACMQTAATDRLTTAIEKFTAALTANTQPDKT